MADAPSPSEYDKVNDHLKEIRSIVRGMERDLVKAEDAAADRSEAEIKAEYHQELKRKVKDYLDVLLGGLAPNVDYDAMFGDAPKASGKKAEKKTKSGKPRKSSWDGLTELETIQRKNKTFYKRTGLTDDTLDDLFGRFGPPDSWKGSETHDEKGMRKGAKKPTTAAAAKKPTTSKKKPVTKA